MSRFPILASRPLFKSRTALHLICNADGAHAYPNTVCDRAACSNPKRLASETLWCDECNALPMCEECGNALIDCPATVAGEECSGYYGCGMSCDEERRWERQQMGICG